MRGCRDGEQEVQQSLRMSAAFGLFVMYLFYCTACADAEMFINSNHWRLAALVNKTGSPFDRPIYIGYEAVKDARIPPLALLSYVCNPGGRDNRKVVDNPRRRKYEGQIFSCSYSRHERGHR